MMVGIACLVLSASACTRPEQEESTQLVSAVDRFRAASNQDKASALAPIVSAPCGSDPTICDAKHDCVTFGERTVEGLRLKAEAEVQVADVVSGKLAKDDPVATALPGKLDDASRNLTEGEAALLRCDEKLMQLKRRWQR